MQLEPEGYNVENKDGYVTVRAQWDVDGRSIVTVIKSAENMTIDEAIAAMRLQVKFLTSGIETA